ncbi:hypothetical protein TMatcc_005125 [Talaromyces marneffei ATCC 18224]|uniref:Calcineurin-like phosphoesterase domain-containing protein n=1 Tax=Talaromyces marneffei (strain ATCC 18224 / CBS 334.59 / QM 7333) TaxID=441960 RepID=B6QCE3_TALMQ|nr:uncharacterized protein EYB26_006303 [Talaromyces marneffei]EEA26598.1 conserved hypothetical protein [Talaromyces marneffei ATCC 18224]KAE8555278.1 hypothetical protein EYB25_003826 [Talaromyces marneffei]QGA18618.1 hypothetical protein EYB26_006303 [Talaromyces marneffei]
MSNRPNPPTYQSPTSTLYAIADIHVAFAVNKAAWAELAPHPHDGLVLCGDVGETVEHLQLAFSTATKCFGAVWWCPGNHELYTFTTGSSAGVRGESKYQQCVDVARSYGVLTPEDDFVLWEGRGGPAVIAPIFTLYDYSFRPDNVTLENAVPWAREMDIEATDEFLLHPDPYPSRQEWCRALVQKFETKLEATKERFPAVPLIIANHWPLREDLVTLKFIPRFSIWCGTKLTADWHQRYNAKVVVSGHLHIRRTDWKNGCRFEEVSLGYPQHWKDCAEMGMGVNELLREILPGPEPPKQNEGVPTQWRRYG